MDCLQRTLADAGDALFLDDIYTNGVTQSRISGIDKIIAGTGDDVIDFTSSRYAYVGTAMEVYGGNGNDTIWMASGKNTLFGDAGNDRMIGGANNDVIVGGIGNDRMHGGGGEDIFCFGENWGNDTIEQLADGEITLWFESGLESNWNADTLTYTDGINTVKVSGVNSVTLKFGADASLPAGAFAGAVSEKIFEDTPQGLLA
jgi:Ca2+-binding RTX toxin-like protein